MAPPTMPPSQDRLLANLVGVVRAEREIPSEGIRDAESARHYSSGLGARLNLHHLRLQILRYTNPHLQDDCIHHHRAEAEPRAKHVFSRKSSSSMRATHGALLLESTSGIYI